MTTPAHCTRTDPHEPHEDRSDLDIRMPTRCPGVEPSADVQATPVGLDPAMNAMWDEPAPTLGDPGQPDPRYIRSGLTTDREDDGAMRAAVSRQWARDDGPDPRLDVVAKLVQDSWNGEDVVHPRTWAQRILDALDDLAGVQTMHEPDVGPGPGDLDDAYQAGYLVGHRTARDELDVDPAPAGLTPAQEIRRWIEFGADIATKAIHVAAFVEHGDDETPEPGCTHDLERWADDLRRLTAAEARADLAEARLAEAQKLLTSTSELMTADWVPKVALMETRLGQVADALRDYDDPLSDESFVVAVRDALEWDPDNDVMTPGMPDPCQPIGCDNGHHLPGCTYAEVPADTATTDAATGDE